MEGCDDLTGEVSAIGDRMRTVSEQIDDWASAGWELGGKSDHSSWELRVSSFLSAAIGDEAAEAFDRLGNSVAYWQDNRDRQAGYLAGLAARMAAIGIQQAGGVDAPNKASLVTRAGEHGSRKVFVVHGHDVAAKEAMARFLERLKLVPIVLNEQANMGRTIIEKFEAFSDVGFAVVLLTPDDVGASNAEPNAMRARARQNVLLELGYFVGKLGRQYVCALFKPGVEIPSDIHGLVFVELDSQGAWKTRLAQELVGARIEIDLQGLL